ncbi:hypothetical protein LINPERPRIM_LOCUS35143 [Linum perenne]
MLTLLSSLYYITRTHLSLLRFEHLVSNHYCKTCRVI